MRLKKSFFKLLTNGRLDFGLDDVRYCGEVTVFIKKFGVGLLSQKSKEPDKFRACKTR